MHVVGLLSILCLLGCRTSDNRDDAIAFLQHLTRDVYLKPLGIERGFFRIEVDRYDLGTVPHAFTVHVFETDQPLSRELLTVDVVRVRGYLQYISASGPAVDGASVSKAAAAIRREAAINALKAQGHVSDRKERRGVRPDMVEMWFTHANPPSYMFSPSSAIFDRSSGVLRMFGVPAVPPER